MEKKKEKKIKNARDWMSPARGKEAEQKREGKKVTPEAVLIHSIS